jgi:plasmid maintenance system antidote protein VapI
MTELDASNPDAPGEIKSVTVQEFNDLQVDALKQQLFIMNTMIQKIINLEKALEDLSK